MKYLLLIILFSVSALAIETRINEIFGITSSASELNQLDGAIVTASDLNKLHSVTSDASELNKLDGCTATTAELNKVHDIVSPSRYAYSNLSATRNITTTSFADITDFSLSIPTTGYYTIVAEATAYVNTGGDYVFLRLADNGSAIDNTQRLLNKGASGWTPFHIEYTGSFTAGHTITLQGKLGDISDVASIPYNVDSLRGYLKYIREF